MLTYLVLVRHGQSVWNLENRFTGDTDVDLTNQGREEARLTGEKLKKREIPFEAAFTSMLKRAQETLDIILQEKNVLVVAHGNSLRSLMMHLENIGEHAITQVDIPTGVPRLYEFDDAFKMIGANYIAD